MPSAKARKKPPPKSPAQAPELLSIEALDEAAECLRTLAHPHRLRMIQMMLQGRYSVGQLAEACGIPSHMASEHLRLMKRCGLLAGEREGRKTFYRVAEPHLQGIMSCIRTRFGKDAGALQGG